MTYAEKYPDTLWSATQDAIFQYYIGSNKLVSTKDKSNHSDLQTQCLRMMPSKLPEISVSLNAIYHPPYIQVTGKVEERLRACAPRNV